MRVSWLLIISLALTLVAPAQARKKREPHAAELHPALQSLSQAEQSAWRDYFQRSRDRANRDRSFIENELKKTVYKSPAAPPAAAQFGFNPKQPADFYKSAEGRRIADIILSFQTPSGGWSKRTDMSQRPRRPGEAFGTESGYIPTFDNKATTTQMRVLALAYRATGEPAYARAALKALDLILEAQFPNGGWPQNFPLTGGYHDYITHNDDVVINNLELLRAVAAKQEPFDFITDDYRDNAAVALQRGVAGLLKTQVIVDGRRTVWGAQHDAFTLQPQSARAFEPAALASQESARIVDFLMRLEPSTEIVAAVNAAMQWFEATRITGYRWNFVNGESASLEAVAGAGPLWARFYEIGGNKPVFGDRDGSIHYDVMKISRERRIKYAWYTELPDRTLTRYCDWKKRHSSPQNQTTENASPGTGQAE